MPALELLCITCLPRILLHENNSRELHSTVTSFPPTPESTSNNPTPQDPAIEIMVKVDKQAAGFDEGRPTVADLHGGNPFAQAAKQHWLRDKPSKFKSELLKTEFYDVLEKEGFRFRSLLILENLQFLEKSAARFVVWVVGGC